MNKGLNKLGNSLKKNRQVVLFLQGPITPFFKLIADRLEAEGAKCLRINLCFGDWLFWRRPGATNYRGRKSDWPAFIDQFIARHGVTHVVLLGEQRFYHRKAIEAAKRYGVEVVATDFGYLRPDWITFERNGMSADSEFPREPEAIRQLARAAGPFEKRRKFQDSFFTQSIWDMAYHLLSSLFRPFYPFYDSHQVYHPVMVYIGTGIRIALRKLGRNQRANDVILRLLESDAGYFVFPLQMQNDFQIRAYSRFNGIEEALEEVVASFAANAEPEHQLVIKVHPLDPGMISWRRRCKGIMQQYGVADRVRYIDGGSLAVLLKGALGVITINSTVGIWSLLEGKPTHTLGESVYNVPGLVDQNSLDQFWSSPTPPDLSLRDDFMQAMAGAVQIRGVYYNQPGLNNAVEEAARRLLTGCINKPLTAE